tara:strand:+ start:311 stop:817 length:507 start_codon:yes stop_codon:yes gene_type:complete
MSDKQTEEQKELYWNQDVGKEVFTWYPTLDDLLKEYQYRSPSYKHIYELGRYHAIEEEQHSGCASSLVKKNRYFYCKSCHSETPIHLIIKKEDMEEPTWEEGKTLGVWIDRKDGLTETCYDCWLGEVIVAGRFDETGLVQSEKDEYYKRRGIAGSIRLDGATGTPWNR